MLAARWKSVPEKFAHIYFLIRFESLPIDLIKEFQFHPHLHILQTRLMIRKVSTVLTNDNLRTDLPSQNNAQAIFYLFILGFIAPKKFQVHMGLQIVPTTNLQQCHFAYACKCV